MGKYPSLLRRLDCQVSLYCFSLELGTKLDCRTTGSCDLLDGYCKSILQGRKRKERQEQQVQVQPQRISTSSLVLKFYSNI